MAKEFLIPLSGLAFYAVYLAVIWPINVLMMMRLKELPSDVQKYAKWLPLSNIFLALGDTLALIGYSLAYFSPTTYGDFTLFGFQGQYAILGVISTSLTVSFYYLFLGMYYRAKFNAGQNNAVMWIIYVFFIIRIILHFNPQNIWFSTQLVERGIPEGTPNYTAWLRNAPFYVYGLLAVALVGWYSYKAYKEKTPEDSSRRVDYYMILAVIAILVSFFFYSIDIFLSHLITSTIIVFTYIFKTIAYVVAAIFMYLAEFKK